MVSVRGVKRWNSTTVASQKNPVSPKVVVLNIFKSRHVEFLVMHTWKRQNALVCHERGGAIARRDKISCQDHVV